MSIMGFLHACVIANVWVKPIEWGERACHANVSNNFMDDVCKQYHASGCRQYGARCLHSHASLPEIPVSTTKQDGNLTAESM